MGSFYLGVFILAAVACAVIGMVVYSVGFLMALVVFGLTALMVAAIYAGIHLVHG